MVYKKRLIDHHTWCGQQDLNLHEKSLIRSLVLCVCQFRHVRIQAPAIVLSLDCLNIISNFQVIVNDFSAVFAKKQKIFFVFEGGFGIRRYRLFFFRRSG